jgi:copper oxidase (laccase) domain-containing protein
MQSNKKRQTQIKHVTQTKHEMMSKDAQRNLGSEQQKQNIDANQIMNTKTLQMQYKITWHKS